LPFGLHNMIFLIIRKRKNEAFEKMNHLQNSICLHLIVIVPVFVFWNYVDIAKVDKRNRFQRRSVDATT
jgi:hypothetical protein